MKKWYALYTKSRYEKKVAEQLEQKGFIQYLPLIKTLKQWSDRKKYVTEPLFKSYIFVCINSSEYHRVLNTTGVVYFVKLNDKPATIPENQINAIKYFLKEEVSHKQTGLETFIVGQKVEIIQGPMSGITGTITKYDGNNKMRIKIEAINHFITLTIPKFQLQIVKENSKAKTNKKFAHNIF